MNTHKGAKSVPKDQMVGLAGFEPTKRNQPLWIQGILDFTVISYTNDTIKQ